MIVDGYRVIRVGGQPSDTDEQFDTDPYPISGPLVSCGDERLEKVRNYVIRDNMCVRVYGQCYIFVTSMAQWVSLYSRVAARMICDITDMNNVSSGFLSAAAPYLRVVDRITTIQCIIPPSFCISTYRMVVKFADGLPTVASCKAITIMSGKQKRYNITRVGGICFGPLELPRVPKHLTIHESCPIDAFLSRNLSIGHLNLIKWFIGNGLRDPVSAGKVLVLYGLRGGEGKSVICHTLMNILRGTIAPMDKDYMGGASMPSAESMSEMLAYRFLYWGDCRMSDGKVNDANWKTFTGGDMISLGSGAVRFQSSVLLATNNLWKPSYNLWKNWFARRTFCIPMSESYRGSTDLPQAFDEKDIVTFAVSCIHLRVRHKHPPLTPMVLIATIFGSRSSVASRAVRLTPGWSYDGTDNENTLETFYSNMAATYSLCLAGEIRHAALMSLVHDMCPAMIATRRSMQAVRGLSISQ